MNKRINNKFELWSESCTLLNLSTYRIVNALRHINPQTASENERHILDSLIRALEYIEDVKAYQYKLRKQMYSTDKKMRELKRIVRATSEVEIPIPEFLWNLEPKKVNKK